VNKAFWILGLIGPMRPIGPMGLKCFAFFCRIGAISWEEDYLACNSHRHYFRAMRHILRFAHWANTQISAL
jgi:hypothetical protein